jgi:hypothetical protein
VHPNLPRSIVVPSRETVSIWRAAVARAVLLARESSARRRFWVETRRVSRTRGSLVTAYDRSMGGDDATELDAFRRRGQDAIAAGRPIEPLVSGPEHALLAKRIASELRDLVSAATGLAELVDSWQYLAGMCGLFDDLDEAERPAPDWRARVAEALARIDEATA